MIRSVICAAVAAALALVTPAFAHNGTVHHGSIDISGAFARATLPNAPVGGGYITITNNGTEADRLISVSSEVAGTVQIHQMEMVGDVMKMGELADGIEIGAGETVTLQPGGMHIMFMNLKGAFVEGETVPVTLTFEEAGPVEIMLAVQSPGADAAPAVHAH